MRGGGPGLRHCSGSASMNVGALSLWGGGTRHSSATWATSLSLPFFVSGHAVSMASDLSKVLFPLGYLLGTKCPSICSVLLFPLLCSPICLSLIQAWHSPFKAFWSLQNHKVSEKARGLPNIGKLVGTQVS